MKTRVYRPSYTDGENLKYSTKYLIQFADQTGIKRRLSSGLANEKQAQHLGGKIDQVVNYRALDKAPPPELSKWIQKNMPDKIKVKLLGWGVLDPELFGEKEITGLDEYLRLYKEKLVIGFKPKLQALSNCPEHVEKVYRKVLKIIRGCKFRTWSDIRFDTVEKYLRSLNIGNKTFSAFSNYS